MAKKGEEGTGKVVEVGRESIKVDVGGIGDDEKARRVAEAAKRIHGYVEYDDESEEGEGDGGDDAQD